jgi:hypothetical protein
MEVGNRINAELMEMVKFVLMLCLVAFGAHAEYRAQTHIDSERPTAHVAKQAETSVTNASHAAEVFNRANKVINGGG